MIRLCPKHPTHRMVQLFTSWACDLCDPPRRRPPAPSVAPPAHGPNRLLTHAGRPYVSVGRYEVCGGSPPFLCRHLTVRREPSGAWPVLWLHGGLPTWDVHRDDMRAAGLFVSGGGGILGLREDELDSLSALVAPGEQVRLCIKF